MQFKVVERVRFWLGWCPGFQVKGRVKGKTDERYRTSKPEPLQKSMEFNSNFNMMLLIPIGVMLLVIASLEPRYPKEAIFVPLLFVLAIIASALSEYFRLPKLAGEGLVLKGGKGKTVPWKNIEDIAFKERSVFMSRWMIKIPVIEIYFKVPTKSHLSISCISISNHQEYYNKMRAIWRENQ